MLHLYKYYIDGKSDYLIRENMDDAHADAMLIAIRSKKQFHYISKVGWIKFFLSQLNIFR